jgi:hypothetical protein
MGMIEQFVEMELRTLDKNPPSREAQKREEWLKGATVQTELWREAAGWIGDHLVAWGEWLRSWGAPRTSIRAS